MASEIRSREHDDPSPPDSSFHDFVSPRDFCRRDSSAAFRFWALSACFGGGHFSHGGVHNSDHESAGPARQLNRANPDRDGLAFRTTPPSSRDHASHFAIVSIHSAPLAIVQRTEGKQR